MTDKSDKRSGPGGGHGDRPGDHRRSRRHSGGNRRGDQGGGPSESDRGRRDDRPRRNRPTSQSFSAKPHEPAQPRDGGGPRDADEYRYRPSPGEGPAAEENKASEAPIQRSGESLLNVALVSLDAHGEDVFVEDAPGDPQLFAGELRNVVVVRIDTPYRCEDFDAGDQKVARHDKVVVESDRGLVIGTVVVPPMRRMLKEPNLRRMLRKLDRNDERQRERHQDAEQRAHHVCKEQIRRHRLPMKLVRVEYVHSGNKAVVYFAAENRVDFRQLVRDLAHELRMRIEIRQIGVRDSAKMTGGTGVCGRELCCSTWLQDFHPVSIRMAKDQNLVLNPTKVSGLCGRLKCCLAYEQSLYHEARKNLPKVGKQVTTPIGAGMVIELDVPRRLVRVSHENGTIETFPANLVTRVGAPEPVVEEHHDEPEHVEEKEDLQSMDSGAPPAK